MFYDKFAELCTAHRKSPSGVATELGISRAAVNKWKRNVATPNGNTVVKIASYFDVSTDYFLETDNGKKEAPPITDGELSLILKMRELTVNELQQITTMVDFLIAQHDQ